MYQKEFAGCQDTITHVPWSWYKLGFPRAPPSFAASPSSSTPWPIVILLPVTRHTTFNVQSLDNPFVRAYYKTIRLLLQTKSAPRVSNRDTLIPSIQIFTLDSVLGVHLNGIENGYTAYRASSLRPPVYRVGNRIAGNAIIQTVGGRASPLGNHDKWFTVLIDFRSALSKVKSDY